MGIKISICGKGGSGKSTLTGLLAQQAVGRGYRTLVVDSDESNSGLYRLLGFDNPPEALMEMVGGKESLKSKMGEKNIFQKDSIVIEEIPEDYIVSSNNLHMVSIGKINRAFEGCACPMGVFNRELLKKLHLGQNDIALIDMEAGIEHFGRGVDAEIDRILLVVEPSFESLALAAKIKELASGFGKRLVAALNKVRGEDMERALTRNLAENGVDVIGVIPDDPAVFAAGLAGTTIGTCDATQAAAQLLDRCITG